MKGLSEKATVLAAKFFTTTNLGFDVVPFTEDVPSNITAIENGYAECKRAHESDGVEIDGEYSDWYKSLQPDDKILREMLMTDASWIFSVK